MASPNVWFSDKPYAPQEMRAIFNSQRREQDALQLRDTGNEPEQRIFSGRRKRHLGRAAIVTIAR